MLTGGEDPLYIARRLVVVASEDVGLGDPHGLPLVCKLSPFLQLTDRQPQHTKHVKRSECQNVVSILR
jgi:hypothetical protein